MDSIFSLDIFAADDLRDQGHAGRPPVYKRGQVVHLDAADGHKRQGDMPGHVFKVCKADRIADILFVWVLNMGPTPI